MDRLATALIADEPYRQKQASVKHAVGGAGRGGGLPQLHRGAGGACHSAQSGSAQLAAARLDALAAAPPPPAAPARSTPTPTMT